MKVWDELKSGLRLSAKRQGLLDSEVEVRGRPLQPVEAIGRPEHSDYPLLLGKESMLEVEVAGHVGHAFTDGAGTFAGIVEDVLDLDQDSSFNRALVAASLNAILRKEGTVSGTRHCTDSGPVDCARTVVARVFEMLDETGRRLQKRKPRISLVGLQPRMADALSGSFEIRITDMDPDNIGSVRAGVSVQGLESNTGNLEWCDAAVVTGTTLTSGTIDPFLSAPVPVLFFGVSIAGAAHLLGLRRFCPCSK